MAGVIIGLIVLASVLLILLVLAQNAKGGMGSQFGGGGVSQAIGVKKGSDLLEKLTWGFAGFLMIASIAVNITLTGNTDVVEEEVNSNFEAAKSQSVLPTQTAPAQLEDAPAETEVDLSEEDAAE